MSNTEVISMVDIDRGKNTINGRHYWFIEECKDSIDKSINPNYLWVIKKDIETAYAFKKENIYSIKDGKFLFEIWYDGVGRGYITDNKHVYVESKWYDSKGELHRALNKADINNGCLLEEWKSPLKVQEYSENDWPRGYMEDRADEELTEILTKRINEESAGDFEIENSFVFNFSCMSKIINDPKIIKMLDKYNLENENI